MVSFLVLCLLVEVYLPVVHLASDRPLLTGVGSVAAAVIIEGAMSPRLELLGSRASAAIGFLLATCAGVALGSLAETALYLRVGGKVTCSNVLCGARLSELFAFCPKCGTSTEALDSETFVGVSSSRTLHRSSCPVLKRVRSRDRVEIPSVELAKEVGFAPCGVCLFD